MESTQFNLELSFDAPPDHAQQHSIRSPKKQKIKNFGLLDRRIEEMPSVATNFSFRAQQILGRYGLPAQELYRAAAHKIAQEEARSEHGAWDWRIWEEKFFQMLCLRRFVPHPLLFATLQAAVEYPSVWRMALTNELNDILQALQTIKSNRSFSGLRLWFPDLSQPQRILDNFLPSFESIFARLPKPYPETESILAAHHPELSQFLLKPMSNKQRRDSLAVEISQGLAGNSLVYELLFREMQQALQQGTDLSVVYLRPLHFDTQARLTPERPCIGAINLAAFIDESHEKILWDELRSLLGTVTRFVQNWRRMAVAYNSPAPWIGLIGWSDALEKLGVDYGSETALLLGERIAEKLAQTLVPKGSPQEAQKLAILPANSRFFAQVAEVSVGVLARSPDFDPAIVLRMQEAFFAREKYRGVAVLRKSEKMEFADFFRFCNVAAETGWLGVKFL